MVARPWHSFSLLLTLTIPALSATPILKAQQPSTGLAKRDTPTSDLVIRKTVSRVVVDIVVTDKQGNAVHGLTQDDFSLKEDGKAQRLLSFEVHDDTKPDYVPPKVPPLPVNTFVNVPKEPEQGPLYVILYDMVNMEREDQMTSRKPLLDFIDSKPPGTRFAIWANTDQTKLIQGFTENKQLLHAALTSEGPGPHLPRQFLYGQNYGMGNTGAAMSMFNHLADYLDGIRGRKNLLWVSSYFPLQIFATPDSPIPVEEVKHTIATMARSQISIYPIDVRGVLISEQAVNTASGSAGGSSSGGAPGVSGKGMNASSLGGGAAAASYGGEDELAQMTGGHAYYSDNKVGDMLNKAVTQGADFYTVTYAPTNQAEDGGQRNIEVNVNKAGYHLEYRRFYYAVSADALTKDAAKDKSVQAAYRAEAKRNDTLYGTIKHGAPMMHDLLFSAHVRMDGGPALATQQQMLQIQDEPAYFRTRRRNAAAKPMPPIKMQKYLIDYLVIDPQLKTIAAQTGREPMLEFAAAAYDLEGRMVNGIANDAVAPMPAAASTPTEAKPAPLFRVEQELPLPLDAAWLRIAVRDTLTDRTGTLEIPLPLKPAPVAQATVDPKQAPAQPAPALH